MFGTGTGGLSSRYFSIKIKNFFMALLLIPIPLFFIPELLRLDTHFFVMILPLKDIILITFLVLFPAGFLTGVGFVAVSREIAKVSGENEKIVPTTYLYESMGSGTGAVLTFLFMILGLPPLQTFFIMGSIISLTLILLYSRNIAVSISFILFLLIYILLAGFQPQIEKLIWGKITGGTLVLNIQGRTSNFFLISKKNARTLYSGYFPVYTYPDAQERAQAYAPLFIAGKERGKVLIITDHGPDLYGIKFSPELVRKDPVFKKIEKKAGLPLYRPAIYGDPVAVIKKIKRKYNIIEMETGIPDTILEERFISPGFMKSLKKRLTKKGLLILKAGEKTSTVPESEEMIIAGIEGRGRKIFKYSCGIPLSNLYLVFSDYPLSITDFCMRKLKQFENSSEFYYLIGHCNQSYFSQYNSIKPIKTTDNPYLYLFGIAYWQQLISGKTSLTHIFKKLTIFKASAWLFTFIILTIVFLSRKFSSPYFILSGFTGLLSENLILFLFQYKFGVIYLHLAMIMGTFMLSLAAGSLLNLKWHRVRIIAPLFLLTSIFLFTGKEPFLIYGGTFFIGAALGFIFSEGSEKKFYYAEKTGETASFAEMIDHLSGAAGALLAPLFVTGIGLTDSLIIVILILTLAIIFRR